MNQLCFFIITLLICLAANQPSHAEKAHAISIFGNLKYGPQFTHWDYVNLNAPKGGALRLGALGNFDSLNPFIVKGTPPGFILYTFARLMDEPHDTSGEFYSWVAESVELAPDRSWITFHLNPQAKFSDEHPITADDVIWSFEILRDQGLPMYRTYYKNVSRIEKLGVHQVRFHFNTTENRELPCIIGQLPILPKHYFEKHPFNETYLIPPPCSGPYQVSQVNPGRSLTLKRVDNWWGNKIPSQAGRYNFEEIQIIFYLDANALFEGFKSGDIDLRQEASIKNWMTSYTFPAMLQGNIVKEEIQHQMPAGTTGFFFNTRRPLFQDRRVRQALTLAFDFPWINKSLFYGAYKRCLSFFENSDFAAQGEASEAERTILETYIDQLPPNWDQPFILPNSDNPIDMRKTLLEAQNLLERAGWDIQDGKLINQSGQPFVFEILFADKAFEKVILFYAERLKKLGIQVKLRFVDTTAYTARVEDKDFDVIYTTILQSTSLGNEQRDFFGSERADIPGTRNYAGIKNPVADALIESLIISETYEQLVNRSRALDRVLIWNFYIIPGWYSNVARIAYWNKFGKPTISPKLYPLDISTWWYDVTKAKTIKR